MREAAKKGSSTVEKPLLAHSRPGLIHVDDTAKAFVRAIEKVHIVPGTGVYPVFDLVTSQESRISSLLWLHFGDSRVQWSCMDVVEIYLTKR